MVYSVPAAIAGTPEGDRQEPRRSLPGHLRDDGRKFCHLGLIPIRVRTVSHRRSSGEHWVSYQNGSRSTKSSYRSRTAEIDGRSMDLLTNPVQLGR